MRPASIVMPIVSFLWGSLLLPAQEAGARALRCLEEERVLLRRAETALRQGDAEEAADLLLRASRLPFLVPPPFEEGDARELMRNRARLAVKAGVALARERAGTQRQAMLGNPCKACGGYGFVCCSKCRGTGAVQVNEGRRRRREACLPWSGCDACGGCGLLGPAPEVAKNLSDLSAEAARESGQRDPVAALLAVLRAVVGKETWGWQPEPIEGGDLRAVVGSIPFDPDRLGQDRSSALRERWGRITPHERRRFLLEVALETLAFASRLRFLHQAPDPGSLAQALRTAEPATLADLELGLDELSGRFVSLVLTGEKPDQAFLEATPFPLAGRVAVHKGDPDLLLCFCYTPEDLEALRPLARLGLVPGAATLLRAYPPGSVPKALRDLGPGRPIRVTGRVLLNPAEVPRFLLEIWQVLPEEDGSR